MKLQKQQYQESDLTFALSNTKDDLLDNKAKHQKKVAELEAEKRELGVKLDELTDSIGELQVIIDSFDLMRASSLVEFDWCI